MRRILFNENTDAKYAAGIYSEVGGYNGNSTRLHVARLVLGHVISDGLTERQREAITLYYFKNMKQSQIADLWHVDQSAVSRHITRGKKRIRKYMDCLHCLEQDYFIDHQL